MSAIRHVIIYGGHLTKLSGPYPESITGRVRMFHRINAIRVRQGKKPWLIEKVSGERLLQCLKALDPLHTLLVIPAGQSTHLDRAFSKVETEALRRDFFEKGGRGYFNCGSAYWVTKKRIYTDLSCLHPEMRVAVEKSSILPLFDGTSHGPLCPFPGLRYRVGFFSDSVCITDGTDTCNVFLSGGGSFLTEGEKSRVLVKYAKEELLRFGITLHQCEQWENAVVLSRIGKGAALLSMFHPYYGPQDFDVERYQLMFPDCGTDWAILQKKLSSTSDRIRFVMKAMLDPLERMEFSP